MYSIKTVEAYIKGEDIEKYTIEELENDPTFMRMIVLATNDKNIYNLCSEKVKLDYEFVKMMIKRFKNDLNFVCQVANYYLENSDNKEHTLELLIIMRGLTTNKEEQEEQFLKYSLKLECFYSFYRIMISEVKKENKCEECGITEWRGKPITIQLHHINGDRSDNRIENLRMLCPNCHS